MDQRSSMIIMEFTVWTEVFIRIIRSIVMLTLQVHAEREGLQSCGKGVSTGLAHFCKNL